MSGKIFIYSPIFHYSSAGFLDKDNKGENKRLPLGQQLCSTRAWGCAEILTKYLTIRRLHYHTELLGRFGVYC